MRAEFMKLREVARAIGGRRIHPVTANGHPEWGLRMDDRMAPSVAHEFNSRACVGWNNQ